MVIGRNDQIVLVQGMEVIPVDTAKGQGMTFVYKTVERFSALFAGGNGINGKAWAGINVTAYKDIFLCRLIGPGIGLRSLVSVQLNSFSVKQPAPFNGLANGRKHVISFHGHGVIFVILRIEPAVRVLNGSALLKHNGLYSAVLCQDFFRAPATVDGDALFFCLQDFIFCGRHFRSLLQRIHGYGISAKTNGRSCHINGNIAAANDNYLSAERLGLVRCHVAQEINTGNNAVAVFSGNTKFSSSLGADGNVKALKAVFSQLIQRYVPANFHTALNFNTQCTDNVYFGIHNVLFQTEIRNTKGHHTAGNGFLFKDRYTVPQHGQVIGTGKTRRAGTNDGNLLTVVILLLRNKSGFRVKVTLRNKLFHFINGNGRVNFSSCTNVLTEFSTDRTAYRRERVFFFNQFQCFIIPAFAGFFNVALYCNVRRAIGLARCRAGFRHYVIPVGKEVIAFPVLWRQEYIVFRRFMTGNGNRIFLTELLA